MAGVLAVWAAGSRFLAGGEPAGEPGAASSYIVQAEDAEADAAQ